MSKCDVLIDTPVWVEPIQIKQDEDLIVLTAAEADDLADKLKRAASKCRRIQEVLDDEQ